MTRMEFLQQLRQALENDLSGRVVQENVEYYNQYITDEISKGKSEDAVLQVLGDPWVLARTVIDAQEGTDQSTVYEAGGSYAGYGNEAEKKNHTEPKVHVFGVSSWWKKLLVVLGIVMVIVVVFSMITGLISLLAPIVIPILIIMVVIKFFTNRRT